VPGTDCVRRRRFLQQFGRRAHYAIRSSWPAPQSWARRDRSRSSSIRLDASAFERVSSNSSPVSPASVSLGSGYLMRRTDRKTNARASAARPKSTSAPVHRSDVAALNRFPFFRRAMALRAQARREPRCCFQAEWRGPSAVAERQRLQRPLSSCSRSARQASGQHRDRR
jgi:hypothetical protein